MFSFFKFNASEKSNGHSHVAQFGLIYIHKADCGICGSREMSLPQAPSFYKKYTIITSLFAIAPKIKQSFYI